MSDRRRQRIERPLRAIATGIMGALLLIAPRIVPAQEAAEWRLRLHAQAARTAAASKAYQESNDVAHVYDAAVRVGGLVVGYAQGSLIDADTAAIASGLRAGIDQLRGRFGDAGAGLATGAWSATRSARRFSNMIILENLDGSRTRDLIAAPVDPLEVERFVIAQAGELFVHRTPALGAYSGYTTFQYDRERDSEIARRLATSWAASGRRCASGALDACAAVLTPFDRSTAIAIHFEPRDYRTVIVSAPLPSLSDSSYFVARRRCIDGVDSVCVSMIGTVMAADPYNAMVRGSLLAHAVALGGSGAVARAAERADAKPIEALAHIAGVSEDSLLASWHRRTFSALSEKRRRTDLPLLLSSIAWGGLLLLVASRRKFL